MSDKNNRFKLEEAMEQYKEALPLMLEEAQLRAKIYRAKYLAYVDTGFTEHDALTLCCAELKRPTS